MKKHSPHCRGGHHLPYSPWVPGVQPHPKETQRFHNEDFRLINMELMQMGRCFRSTAGVHSGIALAVPEVSMGQRMVLGESSHPKGDTDVPSIFCLVPTALCRVYLPEDL